MTQRLAQPKAGYGESYGTSYGTSGATARLHVATAPDHAETAYTITHGDILGLTAARRANKPATTGTLIINNDDWKYSLSQDCPGIDDKLTGFVAARDDHHAHGEGPMGAGPMGGWRPLGTYLVTDREITGDGPEHSRLLLDVQDYVYGILSNRNVYGYADENKPISGTDDAHLNQILQDFAPQVNRNLLPDLDHRLDYAAHGKSVKDVVEELAGVVANEYGSAVHYAQGNRLVLRSLSQADVSPRYDEPLTLDDFETEGSDISSATESHQLVNQMRVDGGTDADNVADAQETVASIEDVSEANRLMVRLDTPKPHLPRFEIYTQGSGTSEDGLRIRLQRDIGDGTGPIRPGNIDYDLINSGARKVALSGDDWTTFRLGEHDAFERAPWLIIDSPGANGYGVGVDANGVPAYRAYFSKPVIAELPDGSSQNDYLQHDGHLTDKAIRSAEAARDRAWAILARKSQPPLRFSADARTDRAHRLRVGDVADLDIPEFRATGRFVLTQRKVTYSGVTLQANLEFTGI